MMVLGVVMSVVVIGAAVFVVRDVVSGLQLTPNRTKLYYTGSSTKRKQGVAPWGIGSLLRFN